MTFAASVATLPALSSHPLVNIGTFFRLDDTFVASYANMKPPFGFNGLGELVYLRTYSRSRDDGTKERWHETVRRVVEGTYSMQRRWIVSHNLGWDNEQGQRSAEEMYDRMWHMKFLPPGRGLWAMGSPLTEERGLFAALSNCAFVSTERLGEEREEPFCWLMEASMLGIGVGFDTKGAGQLLVQEPDEAAHFPVEVPDTREGWVESLRLLLASFFRGAPLPCFDYGRIRPAGTLIKGFGGVAGGPESLHRLHEYVARLLAERVGTKLGITDVVDLMNLIGKCVVAGNVRRSAEIAFGDIASEEYLDLKNPERNPERTDPATGWAWSSNNSVFAPVGADYGPAAARVAINGEPGFAWLDNMRAYGRMDGHRTNRDKRVAGANPCVEMALESMELCTLVEVFPARHESRADFLRTLKFAYLYGKTVTLGPTPWERTNRVMMRNRRIGCSMSGIQQALAKLGIEEFRQWCDEGYRTLQEWDEVYSEWLAVPRSVKITTVKPSGTVSLLAGATPGMHWPEARTYIRRVILGKHSDLLKPLRKAGYPIEQATDPSGMVVEFPVRFEEPLRTVAEVSMWEQLALAAFLQRWWADNQVSCTVTFDPATEGPQIARALDYHQYLLKGISFLPRLPEGAYAQMPYEAIADAEYERRVASLKPVRYREQGDDAIPELYCDTSACEFRPVALQGAD